MSSREIDRHGEDMAKSDLIRGVADKYGRSTRTVRRWEAAGLDLTDSEAVAKYAADQDIKSKGASRNRAMAGRGARSAATALDAVIKEAEDIDPTSEGAPAALARISRIERLLNARLERAIASDDALAISAARQDVAPITALLVRLDREISQARRESGDLIPRADAEASIRYAIMLLRLAVKRWLSCEIPNHCAETVPHIMEQKILTGISNATASSWKDSQKNSPGQVPEWALSILIEEWPGPVEPLKAQ